MTPKEKAKEITEKMEKAMFEHYVMDDEWVQCVEASLVCVEQILKGSRLFYVEDYAYWQEVKKEIELL